MAEKERFLLSLFFRGRGQENPNIKEEVYLKICDALVMEYKSETIGIDDIQISDEPIPEG